MRNVLVTGFGPFGGEPVNPALEAIKLLDGRQIGGYKIATKELPVTRFASIEAIEKFIAETDPVLVLAVGQEHWANSMWYVLHYLIYLNKYHRKFLRGSQNGRKIRSRESC